MVAFDDCAPLAGEDLTGQSLLTSDDHQLATFGSESGEPVALVDQAAFDVYWAAHDLDSIAEKPLVDFATSQVLALLGFEEPACRYTEVPTGFASSKADADAIVLQIAVNGPCDSCDTGSILTLQLWTVKHGTLAACRYGRRC